MSALSASSPAVHAVAGIVVRADGALLMQQRAAAQSYAGYWEFPGGKINTGETEAAALCRELMEEIGIAVGENELRRFVRRQWTQTSGKKVVVDFFVVESYRNTPQSCEGQPLMWASPLALPSPLLPANITLCHWLQLPPFCCITAAEHLGEERMLTCLNNTLSSNKKHCVILRDKTLPARNEFAMRVLECCRARGALVFAADDETLAAQMDGLHLSAAALMACQKRPPYLWVGASCHNEKELQKAAALGLDYALLSPVQKTKSHPQTSPLGWEKLAALSLGAGLPIIALGGLGEKDLPKARQHHAHGVAFMRDAWDGS